MNIEKRIYCQDFTTGFIFNGDSQRIRLESFCRTNLVFKIYETIEKKLLVFYYGGNIS